MSSFNKQFKDNVRLSQNPLTKSATVRTTFDRSHTNKTTFSSGQLIPIYFDEVLPGDTHIVDFKYLIRMSTPTVPTLDNSVIDFHFFYVPTRLLWNNWKQFNGENTSSWIQNTTFYVPKLRKTGGSLSGTGGRPNDIPTNAQYWEGAYYDSLLNVSLYNGRLKGYKDWDLGGYLGLPLHVDFFDTHNMDATITCLPFFAYAKIWNDWYRDQNVQDEIYIPVNSGSREYPIDILRYGGSQGLGASSNRMDGNPYGFVDPYNPGQAILAGFGTLPVSKLPDYFTTSLPSPQKGTPVELSINSLRLNGLAEVINRQNLVTRGTQAGFQTIDRSRFDDVDKRKKHVYQFLMSRNNGYSVTDSNSDRVLLGINANGDASTWSTFEIGSNTAGGGAPYRMRTSNVTWNVNNQTNANLGNVNNDLFYHDMVADLSGVTANNVRTGITINDLRLAFATQQFLEMDARGGSRYIEILRNHFGVISPDARLQRSEYIGGRRDYTDINQVIATTYSNANGLGGQQALGNTGAFSLTTGENKDSIIYSATEHGYIMGFVIIRPLHTYAQGLEKVWTRFTKFDYYWPEFSNIGEQPIYQREIFTPEIVNGQVEQNKQKWSAVFGYNEAWADYRYKLNKASGWFSPNSTRYLSAWTYTDNYANAPVLNAEWMKENRGNIQQTLTELQYDQFLIDLYFNVKSTRPIPAFSIPGLNKM